MRHCLTLFLAGLALAFGGCTIVVEAAPDSGLGPVPGSPNMTPGGKADGGGALCGNSICDPGEDCRCADCPCDGTCGEVEGVFFCAGACPDGQCPGGKRCFEGFAAFDGPVCLPDFGQVPIGGQCDNSLDCGAGLVCSCTNNWNCPGGSVCVEACDNSCDFCEEKRWGTRVCQRDCGPENPNACGDGTSCVVSATRTGCTRTPDGPWVCYPRETDYFCAAGAPPAYGQPCGRERSCGLDEVCVGTDCVEEPEGVGCETYRCSRPCDTDDDCNAPSPICWRASSRDLGFCVSHL